MCKLNRNHLRGGTRANGGQSNKIVLSFLIERSQKETSPELSRIRPLYRMRA